MAIVPVLIFIGLSLLIRYMDRDWYDDETGASLSTKEHDIKRKNREMSRWTG
jgi:hypothetical protein